jgi:hypothetical protein
VELFAKVGKNKESADFLQYFFTYNPKNDKTKRSKISALLKKTRKARLKE